MGAWGGHGGALLAKVPILCRFLGFWGGVAYGVALRGVWRGSVRHGGPGRGWLGGKGGTLGAALGCPWWVGGGIRWLRPWLGVAWVLGWWCCPWCLPLGGALGGWACFCPAGGCGASIAFGVRACLGRVGLWLALGGAWLGWLGGWWGGLLGAPCWGFLVGGEIGICKVEPTLVYYRRAHQWGKAKLALRC